MTCLLDLHLEASTKQVVGWLVVERTSTQRALCRFFAFLISLSLATDGPRLKLNIIRAQVLSLCSVLFANSVRLISNLSSAKCSFASAEDRFIQTKDDAEQFSFMFAIHLIVKVQILIGLDLAEPSRPSLFFVVVLGGSFHFCKVHCGRRRRRTSLTEKLNFKIKMSDQSCNIQQQILSVQSRPGGRFEIGQLNLIYIFVSKCGQSSKQHGGVLV